MTATTFHKPRKVLLAEFNEITWRLVEPLLAKGKLPMFSELIARGTRGSPLALEEPPYLDPWISWTTVYTGRPREEHGVRFLEQPPETVTGPRVWEIAADAGKSLGIFGSIMSWPPRNDVKGFWVPGTFSPASDTFPADLQPIQELNLSQTRSHSPVASRLNWWHMLTRVLRLRRLGLRTGTIAKAGAFLIKSRLHPNYRKWEKVSLQPVVNLDFFEALYAKHRPDFGTFHTNHVAHYQHRYWRSTDPTPFLKPPSREEVRHFGPAIEYGYRVADRVLRRLCRLADENTVVILASGLGQQPYINEDFKEGRAIIRIRDIEQIVHLCGLEGHCTPSSVMTPQWNLKVTDQKRRGQAEKILASAWFREPQSHLFALETVGDTICFNPKQKEIKPFDPKALCVFPEAGGYSCRLGELCVVADPTPKQGYHDRVGLTVLTGPGIRRGAQLSDCTNLDFAPTILHLLGLSIPSYMKGRVLEEAFAREQTVSVPAMPFAEAFSTT